VVRGMNDYDVVFLKKEEKIGRQLYRKTSPSKG
jgi:hypothetical protein